MAKEKTKVRTLNPEERKQFKALIASITHAKVRIDQEKEALKEYFKDIKAKFDISPKLAKKIADAMYNNNYEDIVAENEHFEYLYESAVEGKLTPMQEEEDESGAE